jgi:enterochelin esterase-like enzyme
LSESPPSALRYRNEHLTGIHSNLLGRDVGVELFLPVDAEESGKKYPLLILNDGQDNEAVGVKETLEALTASKTIQEIVVAGIMAGDRIQEYGISSKRDYLGRGKKAKDYSKFLISEVLPYLIYRYPVKPSSEGHVIAGYSLGGLSALDIAWNHPDLFSKVGVFSGSLWWRKRNAKSRFYSDRRDRLMHWQVRNGKFKPGLMFWFQTGTLDEGGDRNENGVIDSIDDTLDLIVELTKKGYRPFHDIDYLEIKDGKHDTRTWAEAMPHFLTWAFKS